MLSTTHVDIANNFAYVNLRVIEITSKLELVIEPVRCGRINFSADETIKQNGSPQFTSLDNVKGRRIEMDKFFGGKVFLDKKFSLEIWE